MGRSPVLVPWVARAGCRQQGAQTEGWLPTGTAEPRNKPCSCLPCTPRVQGEQPSSKQPTAHTARDMPTGLSGKIFLDAHDLQPSAGTRTQLRFGKQAGATLAASRKGLLGCSFLQQPRAHSAGSSSSCPRVFGTVREGLQQAWNPAASKRCLRAVRNKGREVQSSALFCPDQRFA